MPGENTVWKPGESHVTLASTASKLPLFTMFVAANALLNPPINTRDKIPVKRYLLFIFNNFQSFKRIKALCNRCYRLDNLDDTLNLFPEYAAVPTFGDSLITNSNMLDLDFEYLNN